MSGQEKVDIMYFKKSEDYQAHIYFFNKDEKVLDPIRLDLDTSGLVYELAGLRYPLAASKIARDHKEWFNPIKNGVEDPNKFFFRNFVDSTSNHTANEEDIKWALEMFDNKTAAHLFTGHQNKHLRLMSENIIKGKWDHIDFNVNEYTPGEVDQLIKPES